MVNESGVHMLYTETRIYKQTITHSADSEDAENGDRKQMSAILNRYCRDNRSVKRNTKRQKIEHTSSSQLQ